MYLKHCVVILARKTIKTLPPSYTWDVVLSESSSDSDAEGAAVKGPKKPKIVERLTDRKLSLKVRTS